MSDIRLFVSTEEWDLVSGLIRLRTDCAWSHTGFLRKSDGWTFSAMFDGGVKWRPPNPKAHVLALDYASTDAALAWALTKEGEQYDWLDILGIMTGRDWALAGHEICDKLMLAACEAVNDPLLNMKFIPIEHFAPDDILKSLKVSQGL